MAKSSETESRKLLRSLRDTLASEGAGQERLDHVVGLIAASMGTDVCSIYLFRDPETLELCATEGLNAEAVHKTRMRLGEGLVGRVARRNRIVNTANAPQARGFRFMPETGEEVYSSFLGVPIQRLGEKMGVLVVQSKEAREYSEDEIYALEVVAMVLAEMAELGAFVGTGDGIGSRHQDPVLFRGAAAQEGMAEGQVWLHDPRVLVTNPVADDPEAETVRLRDAVDRLRLSVDEMLSGISDSTKEQREVIEAYRMFANSKGWMKRMENSITSGLSAEAAVEKEQSVARARMGGAESYLRDRLHDLDDLSNRLLRILTGQGKDTGAEMPDRPILLARTIGPAELLDYDKKLAGIVLEQGSVGSHATIIARALSIPLIIHCDGIATEALNGDHIILDGENGLAHLRPEDSVASALRDKIAMEQQQKSRYATLRDEPSTSVDGIEISLHMNAGLMADLPSLQSSGAEGVGLFRTELQFLIRNQMPQRSELSALYARVLDNADGKRVVFRTLDIGSDKVLPYMKPQEEPNPAMGWRAIRVGLDKPGILRMQLQALLRAANGRNLTIMFPFIAQYNEFRAARAELDKAITREIRLGHGLPGKLEVGAMLETPSLAFAPRQFFEEVDFLSIGGNDLKQFFFAADRENERVRRRYDSLNTSFLNFIEQIVEKAAETETPLSFCGEDAGRPVEALCLAAIGLRNLSMRPASIGPVKDWIRRTDLAALKEVIDNARLGGAQSVRPAVTQWLRDNARPTL